MRQNSLKDKNYDKKLLFVLVAVAFVFNSFGSSALCNSVGIMKEKARKYYWGTGGVEQDYEKAFELYIRAAQTGDPEAQFIAGAMYNVGLGVDKSIAKSFPLLHNAALQGKSTVDSQMAIAQAYLLGQGVKQDIEEAIDWYTRAAEKSAEAQNELGFIYSSGRYVPEDYEKAISFFEKAAFNGHPVAQYNLGITYYTGMGQEYDLQKSYAWFQIANDSGHDRAGESLKEISHELTQEEINEAKMIVSQLEKQIKNDG